MKISRNYVYKSDIDNIVESKPLQGNQQPEQIKEYGKNLNFTGLRNMHISNCSIGLIRKAFSENSAFKATKDFCEHFKYHSEGLSVKPEELAKIAKENKLKQKSADFAILMGEHVHYHAYESGQMHDANAIKENTEAFLELFKRVRNPQPEHMMFIERTERIPLKTVKQCFDKCDDNPGLLGALLDVAKVSKAYLTDLVEIPNLAERLNDYAIHTKKVSKGIIDESELYTIKQRAINKIIFNESKRENQYDIDILKEELSTIGIKNNNYIDSIASPEKNKIIRILTRKLNHSADEMDKETENHYLNIYSTTNKNNVKLREDYLERTYINRFKEDKSLPKSEVANIDELFNIIDRDKDAAQFVEKCVTSGKQYSLLYPYECLEIFQRYGTKELNIRSSNLVKEMNKNYHKKSMLTIVMEYMEKPKSIGERYNSFAASIKGMFSKQHPSANMTEDLGEKEVIKLPEIIKKPEINERPKIEIQNIIVEKEPEKQIIQKEESQILPIITADIKSQEVQPKKTIQKSNIKTVPFSLAEANKAHLAEIMTNSPSKTMSKKLKISQESVSPILKKTIKSERVLNEQEYLYAINATKMRANMLPEIFASVKETRAEARLSNNGKLPKGFASNENVIELYTRINGKNKKLVNYMLKQTKKDDNGKTIRAFNIKDILEKLDDAHKEIIKGKHSSTKENKFTSKDEKRIFDNMLNDLKLEYGELPKKPRMKKK